MNNEPSRRRGPLRAAALIAAATAAAAPLTAAQASAASSGTGGPISRAEVIQRAKTWTDANVSYSQHRHRDGYRTDCSGFVDMAWRLTTDGGGPNTDGLAQIADRIDKDQLANGDVLLMTHADSNDPKNGHVVIFLNWANADHSAYLGMEEAGGEGAVAHVLPYPYHPGYGTFRPYHYAKTIDNTPTQNLLTNGDFEGSGGWDMWQGSNLTTNRGPQAHGGQAYGAVNTGSLDPSQGPSFFQDVWGARLEPGKKYSYSMWVRPEANRPYQGRLDLWLIGEDGRQERAETPFTAQPGTWTQVTATETVPATGYHHMRAQMYEDTAHDTLDVDDAVVAGS